MEQPYKGRAIIQDNLTDMHIIIPTKKNWFIIIFLGAWLGGWLMGEMVVSRMLITQLADNPAGLFVLFWLIAWTAGGFFAIRTFLWMVKGKEIITVGQNILKIDRKGSLFFKSKLYNLDQVKYIRVQDDFSNMFWRRNDFSACRDRQGTKPEARVRRNI